VTLRVKYSLQKSHMPSTGDHGFKSANMNCRSTPEMHAIEAVLAYESYPCIFYTNVWEQNYYDRTGLWPVCFPDLSLYDLSFWGTIKQRVYRSNPTIEEVS
jgi:hypothetical protein